MASRMTRLAEANRTGAAIVSVSCSRPPLRRTPKLAASGALIAWLRRQPSGLGARRAYQARVQPGNVWALALIQAADAVRALAAPESVRGSWQVRARAAATACGGDDGLLEVLHLGDRPAPAQQRAARLRGCRLQGGVDVGGEEAALAVQFKHAAPLHIGGARIRRLGAGRRSQRHGGDYEENAHPSAKR
jgi:hypothetical protein